MVGVCLLSHRGSPALGPSASSSATPNSAGSLAEVVATLIECGAVRMTGSPVASTAGEGNGESPDAAAAANNPTLLPTDGKIAAVVQQAVGVAELTVLIEW